MIIVVISDEDLLIPSQKKKIFDHLVVMLHPISYRKRALTIYNCSASFVGESFLSLLSLDFVLLP